MTTILIKKKDTAGAPAPGDLTNAAGGAEIAVNTATKRLYTKDSSGTVVELGTNATSSTIDQLTVVTSTTLSYGTANQVQYLNGSKLLVGSANLTFNGTTLVANDFTDSSLTAGRVTYAGTAGNLTDSANMTFNGTTLTAAGFSGPLNGTVGATTPNTGAFTTLSASSTVTLSGGTANGVVYLNGSKVVTTDTAISFNGATLNVNGNTFGRGAGAVSGNIAIGDAPLYNNVSGSASIAIGQYALFSQTTGAQNIGIGTQAANGITTGNYNLAVGFQALYANGGSASASNNTAIGYGSQFSNLSGTYNVSVGQSALAGIVSGSYNTAVGVSALTTASSSSNNTAVGNDALRLNTGGNNTAVGYGALYSNVANNQGTALGYRAGYGSTGGSNIHIGFDSGYASGAGSFNTIVGLQAGYNASGNRNTFIGFDAGFLTTGSRNTFIGGSNSGNEGAGYFVTSGNANTILGNYNGNQGGLDIRTLSNQIVLSDGDGNPRFNINQRGDAGLNCAIFDWSSYTHLAIGNASCSIYNFSNYELGTVQNAYYGTGAWRFAGSGPKATWVIQYDGNWSVRGTSNTGSTGTGITWTTLLQAEKDKTIAIQGANQAAGTGITFPATQYASSDANTLDDYEEGTWTPTYAGTSTNPTVSYNQRNGRYVKIGRFVQVTFELETSSVSGGSGDLLVTGLPFTALNERYVGSAVTGYANAFVTRCPRSAYVGINSTDLYLTSDTAATSQTNNTVANLTTSGTANYLIMTATYQASA